MAWTLFVLNPGSTSTKTALFRDQACIFQETIRHDDDELQQAVNLIDQLPMRLASIEASLAASLEQNHLDVQDIDAFVGRGGLIKPVTSGTYRITPDMLDDLTTSRYGAHACNLGGIIADHLSKVHGKPSFIVDPPTVDELDSLARYSGLPEIPRTSIFHALNQKIAARKAAAELNLDYLECSLIVAHLGGGISVGAHHKGRVIDMTNALDEGPFTPERAGSLPTLPLLRLMCQSGCDLQQMRRKLVGRGGLYAYTGTVDCRKVEDAADTNPASREVLIAMAYQVAKSIASLSPSLHGKVDAIVLTGGLARSSLLTRVIIEHVRFLGPILVYPGEFEMEALAQGGIRVLNGEENALDYCHERSEFDREAGADQVRLFDC